MSETKINTPEEIISAFSSFLTRIYSNHTNYFLVVIPGKRLLSIFYKVFCANLQDSFSKEENSQRNIVSDTGFLLHHKALASHYQETGSFPSILIVEDVLVHGRHIGKLLHQMEQAVIADIECDKGFGVTADERERIFVKLSSAIRIHTFVQSRYPLLLGDNLVRQVSFDYKLYYDSIHQVYDALYRAASPLSVAGPFCIFSIQDKESLHTLLTAQKGLWTHIQWRDTQPQELHCYIRSYLKDGETNLVSTVRFYNGEHPVLIGTALFNKLDIQGSSERSLSSICQTLIEIFSAENTDFSSLCGILSDKNKYSSSVKCNLLLTILSIGDLMDFCEEYQIPFESLISLSDSLKFTLYYGPDAPKDLHHLASSGALCRRLSDEIRRSFGIYSSRNPFPTVNPKVADFEARFENVNNQLKSEIYELSVRSEKEAFCYAQAPFLYRPQDFANYDSPKKEPYVQLAWNYINKGDCEWIAAYIAHVDSGDILTEIQSVSGNLRMVLRAGEHVQFYLPRQLSLFIPALSYVEKKAPMLNMEPRQAVRRFVLSHMSYPGKNEYIEAMFQKLKSKIDVYSEVLYNSGQSFIGWNIPAVTMQKSTEYQSVQENLLSQARMFSSI